MTGWVLRLGTAALGLAMIPVAFRGVRVTNVVLLGRGESLETRLIRGVGIWPQSEFFRALGNDRFARALAAEDGEVRRGLMEAAVGDYQEASRIYPYDPDSLVNRARLLSLLGRDEEAGEVFRRAIVAEGAFEVAFKAHHYFAEHLYRKGLELVKELKWKQAKDVLGEARGQLAISGEAAPTYYFAPGEVRKLRFSVWGLDDYLEGYFDFQEGMSLWKGEKHKEALEKFRAATELLQRIRTPEGGRPPKNSWEAILLAKARRNMLFLEAGLVCEEANRLLAERRAGEALAAFRKAARALSSIRTPEGKRPPEGSPERVLLEDLRQKVRLLEGAGFKAPEEGKEK